MAVDILSEAYPMIPLSCRSNPAGRYLFFKISSFAYAYDYFSPFCILSVSGFTSHSLSPWSLDWFCLTFFVCCFVQCSWWFCLTFFVCGFVQCSWWCCLTFFVCCLPVFRIQDILVWIRIQCLWLMDPDSDPDPAIFQQKNNWKKSFSDYYFLKVHLHRFQR